MTDTEPAPIAATLRFAAADLKDRCASNDPDPISQYRSFGGAAYSLLHFAAQESFAGPAIVALEKYLRVGQIQHAAGSSEDLQSAMLAAANALDDGSLGTDEALQVAALRRQINAMHIVLCAALGVRPDVMKPAVLVDYAASRLAELAPSPLARVSPAVVDVRLPDPSSDETEDNG